MAEEADHSVQASFLKSVMKFSLKTKIEIVSFANNLLQDLVGITTSLQIKIYLFLNKKNFCCSLLERLSEGYPLKNSWPLINVRFQCGNSFILPKIK
jgi:hypothetical protein